jgi:hypothetical protein
MRPASSFVEYCNVDKGWLDLGAETYSIVYPVGTQVCENFPGHGYFWGYDAHGLHYKVEYSYGDFEKIENKRTNPARLSFWKSFTWPFLSPSENKTSASEI